jgi:hypothetical protein
MPIARVGRCIPPGSSCVRRLEHSSVSLPSMTRSEHWCAVRAIEAGCVSCDGWEQVNGTDAYHITGALCQYKYCPDTQLWLRFSDLSLVKFTQHLEDSDVIEDVTYTNPIFNTGATIAAP